jgi:hypothetical protein
VSGNTLFVALNAFPNLLPGGTVGEYDATAGVAINATEVGLVTTVGWHRHRDVSSTVQPGPHRDLLRFAAQYCGKGRQPDHNRVRRRCRTELKGQVKQKLR